jgi:hypothetical protein
LKEIGLNEAELEQLARGSIIDMGGARRPMAATAVAME